MIVGLVINPIAGMGGKVALKGTDAEALEIAIGRGASPTAERRAEKALSIIPLTTRFLTASGSMGEDVLKALGFEHEVVHRVDGRSGTEDTVRTCRQFRGRTELVLFCGGDGTARDVLTALRNDVPVVGIPSGVKMHSAVFANTPEEAGMAVSRFVGGEMDTRLAEVMDVDEEAFRSGELRSRLYGYLKVPDLGSLQPAKGVVFGTSDEEQKVAIAEYLVENMEPGTIYVLGPGTSTKAVADRMRLPKTLLGVDVYLDGDVVQTDATEEDLLRLLNGRKAKLLVTPIGRQGFVLGRGNQQLSPGVIEMVGLDNVLIIATPTKLAETPMLHSDSGDSGLDQQLCGYRKVLIGYDQYRMVRCH